MSCTLLCIEPMLCQQYLSDSLSLSLNRNDTAANLIEHDTKDELKPSVNGEPR